MWKFLGSWNLQFFNNIIALGILIICSLLITIIFDIKKTKSIIVCTGIFLVFPTVTSMIFFPYISIYYSLSILLIFVGVFFSEKYKYGWIFSIILGSLSLGIYQANFSIMTSIYMLLLIKKNFNKDLNSKIIILGFKYFFTLLMGVFLYMIILKLSLKIFNENLLLYDGVDLVNSLSFSNVLNQVIRIYKEVLFLPFNNVYGLSPSLLISISIGFINILTIYLFMRLICIEKIFINKIIIILIFILFPIAIHLSVIMVNGNRVYTLMTYGFVFLFIIPIVLIECIEWNKNYLFSFINKMIYILLCLVIYGYSYFSNVNYTAMYYTTMQTQNYLNQVVLQIKMQKGFNENMKWVFVGNIRDPLTYNPWKDACIYGGNHSNYYNEYSRVGWIEHYLGYYPPIAYVEDYKKENDIEIINKMPLYPNDGSIQIVDNYVIIKFSELN